MNTKVIYVDNQELNQKTISFNIRFVVAAPSLGRLATHTIQKPQKIIVNVIFEKYREKIKIYYKL